MPIAKLNRDKLRLLAEARIEEARVLLDNGKWSGSYYLSGLGVECALKSCLAAAVKEYDFPDKEFVQKMYVHKLENLFVLNGALWDVFQTDTKNSSDLARNWETVRDWDDAKRYDTVEELEARELYEAAAETRFGIMSWIRGKW